MDIEKAFYAIVCLVGLAMTGIVNYPHGLALPPYPPDIIDHVFMRSLNLLHTSPEYDFWSVTRIAVGALIFGFAGIRLIMMGRAGPGKTVAKPHAGTRIHEAGPGVRRADPTARAARQRAR